MLGLGVSSSHPHHGKTSHPATGAFITGDCSTRPAARGEPEAEMGRVLLDAGGERAV